MERRGFLKLLSATIATPLIAKAAMEPELIIPGIERVAVIEPKLITAQSVHFARSVLTPGGEIGTIAQALSDRICLHVPRGTFYQLRAVPVAGWEVQRHLSQGGGSSKYARPAYAVMWVTAADVKDQPTPHDCVNLGWHRAGIDFYRGYRVGP